MLLDNIKFLENIKQGFKRKISWKKCRSEITTQPENNNLHYLIVIIFRNINRLFVLSYKNGNDDPTRDSVDEYYMKLIETKYFNAVIEQKDNYSSTNQLEEDDGVTMFFIAEKAAKAILKFSLDSIILIEKYK